MNETFNVISYVVSCLTFNLNFVHCIKLVSPKCLDTWFVATFSTSTNFRGGVCRPCRAGGLPAAPPPGGRCLPPGRGVAGARQGPPCKKKLCLFIYRSLPPPAGR